MNGKKIYYMETNALYSLANYLGVIAEKVEAHTSLFAIQEIVSQIDEENYCKRKSVLSKLRSSNLKIIPYLPKEMAMLAFRLNISELDQIKHEKSFLWNQAMLVCSSSSYDEYCEKAKKRTISMSRIARKSRMHMTRKQLLVYMKRFTKKLRR